LKETPLLKATFREFGRRACHLT